MTVTQKTSTKLDVPGHGAVEVPTGLFINNEWVPAKNGATFEVVNPATGKKLVDISHASDEDVDAAVKAARDAFENTWGTNIDAGERIALINKLADLLERDTKLVAALESLDSGKGVRMAATSDVPESIGCLRYYAGLADKVAGQTINHFGPDKFAYTLQQPIGVCGQIIPWNYPLMMLAWKIAPALAAGCTIVMKPSELTPLTALYICNLAKEAGFPPGVLNMVPGLGKTTGNAISHHMDIDKIAFTGSVPTGRAISIAAAESNLKKVTLELGGKSPALIFEGSDLQQAANWISLGIYFNSGQDCCASSRVYVQDSVHDEFVKLLAANAKAAAIGKPEDDATSFGPLISEGQRDKVLNYVGSAKQEGAKIATGGKTWGNEGYFVEPTVITDIGQDMKCVREEIFGPVVVVGKFSDEKEAIKLANDTTYGLAGAVFSKDASQVQRVAQAIKAGTIWINNYGILSSRVPFGGFKQSGIGRELGTAGMDAYLQTKAIHQNLGEQLEWPL